MTLTQNIGNTMTQLSLFNADTNEISQDVWQTTTHFATLDELLKYGLRDSNCYSFTNWHCTYQSLPRRAKSLLAKAKFLRDMGIVTGDHIVRLCNFNPACGNVYDGCYLTSPQGNRAMFYPSCGHTMSKGLCEFTWWHHANVSDEVRSAVDKRYPNLIFKSWSSAKKAIQQDPELREFLKAIFN